MISYKELRIDNWVIAPRIGYCQVYGLEIKSDGKEFAWVWAEGMEFKHRANLKDLTPIAITPEILGSCGFVLCKAGTFEGNKYFIKDGFNQLADYGSQGIVLSDKKGAHFECGYYENTIDCQFLHQLQNLHFALAGEELKISLPAPKQLSHS